MKRISTGVLEIGYEEGGHESAPPVLLLHGWPDDVRGWRGITIQLEAAGFRWIAPWLRGCGHTRFLDDSAVRDGRAVALAKDALDLADQLGLGRFAVVGHDWGARAAYTIAALVPERLSTVIALALAYAPNGAFPIPGYQQSRRWWYQWFMTTDRGAEAVRADPIAFARIQWDTWSPPGWFNAAEFAETAKSFANPDWVPTTLHAYRSRWKVETCDGRYDALQAIIERTRQLRVSALFIQGAADECDHPSESNDQGRFFSGDYRRIVLEAVGHFPAREASEKVAEAVVQQLLEYC